MEVKHTAKTLPGKHFKTSDGRVIKEAFTAKTGEIYIVETPVKLSSATLAKDTAITLAFKNAKATFYRVVPAKATA